MKTTSETHKPNLREALRLLGVYTAGRYDIYALAGSARAGCRAHIMSELVGAKTPQSKAGVTALRSAFYVACQVTGECEAHRERTFVNIARDWSAPLTGSAVRS
jgi:hypothetical protein